MTLLSTHGLTANYGQFRALFGVDVRVAAGETVAIIGANGAGKTTLLRSITGVLRNEAAMVMHRGQAIGAMAADQVMQRGIAMVPEGRRLFPSLSVEENLLIGGQVRRAPGPWSLASIYDLFPILKERRHSPGTALSGGQQQMVAIGRALMARPKLLLLDEPSLGLAPMVVRTIFALLQDIRRSGTAILLVEQNATAALRVADYAYVMDGGRVSFEGPSADLKKDERIIEAYLGGRSQ
jgi:branched-chain amino acid transport system ATP-binding protein